jgi:murein DD-endopeptidase MepM/ murein hydrolase activator NlpD
MKKSFGTRVGDFLAGQGFYIVLFLCLAAIGISGYVLFSSLSTLGDSAAVSQPTQMVVDDAPSPSGTETAAAVPSPSASASPEGSAPSAAASAQPSDSPSPAAAAQAEAVTPTAFTWPVNGGVIGSFSLEVLAYDPTMQDWRVHSGIDISAAVGATVMAIADGTVTAVFDDGLMGTAVTIDHGGELTSTYYNLAATPTVSVGDQVSRGAILGSVGTTAMAESALSSHLHLEMAQNGLSVDPASYLPQ